jgi:NADPH:quinone reductase-like Zn-dependent oxidoreductase
VAISADPMELEAAQEDKFAMRFTMQPNSNELSRLAELIDNGTIHPVIDSLVPMQEAKDAMTSLQKGHTYGKLGVRIS